MLTAVIDEQACTGCGICLDACPFDAIIGAPGYMHTVLTVECIGCKLCINPCPIDCINLLEVAKDQQHINQKTMVAKARQRRVAKLRRTKINAVKELPEKSQDIIRKELDNICKRSGCSQELALLMQDTHPKNRVSCEAMASIKELK